MAWDPDGFCSKCQQHLTGGCSCRGAAAELRRRRPNAQVPGTGSSPVRNEPPEQAPHPAGQSHDVPAETGTSRRIVLTAASSIKPRPVLWGWEDRMPAGHICLIPGREGIGKSLFLIWLTAQITRGTLPGAYQGAARPVFYCATEDSWQHTIVPRLIAAGANLDLVYRIDVESVEASTGMSAAVELTMPRDCDLLGAEIKRLGVAMVALDPLMSVIDRTVDTYNDRDMRTVLEPLGRLADATGCMIAGLAHFNKSADVDPLNLVTGSRAFTAFVRSVVAIVRDPEDEQGGCVISQVKNNLGRLDLPNLTYVIQSATIETEEGDCKVGRLHFTGESAKGVRDILAETGSATDRTERAECAEWLQEALKAPQRSREVEAEATAHGFSKRTVMRARQRLGVKAEQLQTGPRKRNEWWLSMPAQSAAGDSAAG
jgi:RecA-family ATPase